MLQKLRENQKLIVCWLMGIAFAFAIGFLLLEFVFKPDVYTNFIWMPILALILASIAGMIEYNRLLALSHFAN